MKTKSAFNWITMIIGLTIFIFLACSKNSDEEVGPSNENIDPEVPEKYDSVFHISLSEDYWYYGRLMFIISDSDGKNPVVNLTNGIDKEFLLRKSNVTPDKTYLLTLLNYHIEDETLTDTPFQGFTITTYTDLKPGHYFFSKEYDPYIEPIGTHSLAVSNVDGVPVKGFYGAYGQGIGSQAFEVGSNYLLMEVRFIDQRDSIYYYIQRLPYEIPRYKKFATITLGSVENVDYFDMLLMENLLSVPLGNSQHGYYMLHGVPVKDSYEDKFMLYEGHAFHGDTDSLKIFYTKDHYPETISTILLEGESASDKYTFIGQYPPQKFKSLDIQMDFLSTQDRTITSHSSQKTDVNLYISEGEYHEDKWDIYFNWYVYTPGNTNSSVRLPDLPENINLPYLEEHVFDFKTVTLIEYSGFADYTAFIEATMLGNEHPYKQSKEIFEKTQKF